MTEHLAKEEIERLSARAISSEKASSVLEHVENCAGCYDRFVEALRSQTQQEGLTFSLAPEDWARNSHIDYEQLQALSDSKLGDEDLEILNNHLTVCTTCQEDIHSFKEFRREIAPEFMVSYGPVSRNVKSANVTRVWSWRPAYTLAALLLVVITLIVAAIFWRTRTSLLQAKRNPTPISTPNNEPSNSVPSPLSSIPKPPDGDRTPPDSNVIVAVNDANGQITLKENGEVIGLDDLTLSTRQSIADALRTQTLPKPRSFKELIGDENSLRGSRSEKFKVLAPVNKVIAESRPTFHWQQLSNATSYRVYVVDLNGNEVAKSEQLSPSHAQWRLTKALRGDQTYSWAVTATVDGEEIVSPGPSSSEARFRIISSQGSNELNSLKKRKSHLALCIFYLKVGMRAEAEYELNRLVALNSDSPTVNRLKKTFLR